MRTRVLLACLPLLLAGCASPSESAALDDVAEAQPCLIDLSGELDRTAQCEALLPGGGARLVLELLGDGGAWVKVQDGAGEVVFHEVLRMEEAREVPLEGAPGAWSLEVMFYDAHGWARVGLGP